MRFCVFIFLTLSSSLLMAYEMTTENLQEMCDHWIQRFGNRNVERIVPTVFRTSEKISFNFVATLCVYNGRKITFTVERRHEKLPNPAKIVFFVDLDSGNDPTFYNSDCVLTHIEPYIANHKKLVGAMSTELERDIRKNLQNNICPIMEGAALSPLKKLFL